MTLAQGRVQLLARVRERPREAALAVAALLVCLVFVMAAVPSSSARRWPTARAREAPFVEAIGESGTIAAARMRIYSARLAGAQAKIVELAAEGSSVASGDLLVRFDASGLEQSLQREAAALRVAEAELVRAREERRLEGLRARAELDAAREDVTFAERELASEVEGRGKLQEVEAQAAAAEAAREHERARRTLDDMQAMLGEGFVTRMEVERADQTVRRAQEQQRIAQLKLESLTKYERPASIEKSKAQARGAEQGAIRSAESAAARIAQRDASVAIALGRVAEIQARLRLIRDQIAETAIRADGPGLVVYRELFFGSDKRKPQVGDEVWPNQPLIALPDSSQLIVETRVREVDLHRVSASQRVWVQVDAYPELRLPAAVQLVGALAVQDESRATKYFPITVKLMTADPRLRTGMTARVDIEVASLPQAVVVPSQAVFERWSATASAERPIRETVAFVMRDGRPRAQTITVAGDNGIEVAVATGLRRDDVVLLADPTVER